MEINLRPSRFPHRSSTSIEDVTSALDDCMFCTIAYSHNGQPSALPTGFCLADGHLVIHGSEKSAFMQKLATAGQVCISAFSFDGLVLAHSAFAHSVNYRSVTIFSEAVEVVEYDEKYRMLRLFTENYAPGRWPFLRPMTEQEVKATKVLKFSLEQASVKSRVGPPSRGGCDADPNLWTGVLKTSIKYDELIPSPDAGRELEIPEHIHRLLR